MEVHHHSHSHGKKNWRSYGWEFLMLFLAVFCGSLAELQVEHYIENQREIKYVTSLQEDLQRDTADGNADLKAWELRLRQTDTLRAEIEKGADKADKTVFYRLAHKLTYNNTYSYHDRTISQLKNGGNFRLIRKKNIADTLIEYDASVVYGLKDVEQFYTNSIFPQLRTIRDRFVSSKYYGLTKEPEKLEAALLREPEALNLSKGKEDALFEYYNTLYEMAENTSLRIRILKRLLRQAEYMLDQIDKEYDIH